VRINFDPWDGERPAKLKRPCLRISLPNCLNHVPDLAFRLLERLAGQHAPVERQPTPGGDDVLLGATFDPAEIDARARKHGVRAGGEDGAKRTL